MKYGTCRMKMKNCLPLLLAALFIGCGHSKSQKIGLMSFGNLEGKTIPDNVKGKILKGKDCGHTYYLSKAVREALKETEYDTFINAEVTNKTSILVPLNCIEVKGKAINSKKLSNAGDKQ